MKTWIAKKLIDRSIDDNRPVPEWVDRLIATNPLLRQYQVEQQDLVAQLRSDAPGWLVESSPAPTTISTATAPIATKNRVGLVAMAVAACALLAIVWFANRPADAPQPVVDAPAPEPFKPEDVDRAVRRGRRMVDQVSLGLNDYAALAAYANPNELGRKTREYVQEAGSVYGRGLAVLNRAGSERTGNQQPDSDRIR